MSAREAGVIFHSLEAAAAPMTPPVMPPQLMSTGSLKFIAPDINSGINSKKPAICAPAIVQAMTQSRELISNLPLNGGFLLKRRTIMKAVAILNSIINPYEGMNFSLSPIVNLKSTGSIVIKKDCLATAF